MDESLIKYQKSFLDILFFLYLIFDYSCLFSIKEESSDKIFFKNKKKYKKKFKKVA